jgi:DNA-binding response OmpR family regulator
VRVLLVEDSKTLRKSVARALRATGYAVDETGEGPEALHFAQSVHFDAIVLDIMLPGLDGLTILTRLRRAGNGTPVLLLTARDTVEDRVRGLQIGADDYLTKPFAIEELLARIQALCRRGYPERLPILRIGDLQIDTAAKTVQRAGQAIDLTAREYALLEFLMRRRGEVVSRTEIEEHIYNEDAALASNAVDSAVCSVRRKLQVTPAAPPLIHTRRGQGYVVEESAE